jgi:hypothetical protein
MTFKENPNPENPRERPMRPEILEVWPKDRNYKQAFLSYMMDWYERYRDVHHSNILNIKRPTIEKESRTFREQSDIMAKFIHQTLEFVGNEYIDEEDPNKPTIKVEPIKLVEIVGRYQDWHRANVDKDPPSGMVITNNVVKYPEIEKYLVHLDSNALYLTQHILHGVGETWNHKNKKTGQKRSAEEAMSPLTHHSEPMVPEVGLPVLGDGPKFGPMRPQLSDPPVGLELKIKAMDDLSKAPRASDNEEQELKIMYPEFNKPEVNENLMAKLPNKERREMEDRMNSIVDQPTRSRIDDIDPLGELDSRVEQYTNQSRKGHYRSALLDHSHASNADNVLPPDLEELDLDAEMDPTLPEITAQQLIADLTYNKKPPAKPKSSIRETRVQGSSRYPSSTRNIRQRTGYMKPSGSGN